MIYAYADKPKPDLKNMKTMKFEKSGIRQAVALLAAVMLIALPSAACAKNKNKKAAVPVTTYAETGMDRELTKRQHGIPVYEAAGIEYKRDGKTAMNIVFGEPVVAGVADKPLGWGYFQFPGIYKSTDGSSIIVRWNMSEDSAESYGKGGSGFRVSTDNGRTWQMADTRPQGGGTLLPNGDRISIITPPALKVSELNLPEPVATCKEAYGRTFSFYRHESLPEQLKGVYLSRWDAENKHSRDHATLIDPGMVRYTDNGLFPIVWWGDMKVLADNSVDICIYPAFYENENGGVDASGVAVYNSADYGRTWTIKSKIPYVYDAAVDPNGARRLALGFTEPAFEILSDGTYLCVLRTTDGYGNSPMYISRSTDQGATWSHPVPFTPSGVLPKLLQLDNGALVLASGRPGMQLRFSCDGKGEVWTDPFEMLPYEDEKEHVSCGYPELLATGPDTFLIVYSDFKYDNGAGEVRKAIKVREVKVTPKKKR